MLTITSEAGSSEISRYEGIAEDFAVTQLQGISAHSMQLTHPLQLPEGAE